MAKRVKTSWICDGCGKEVAKPAELRAVEVDARAVSGAGGYHHGGKVDLCEGCRVELRIQLVEYGFDPERLVDAFRLERAEVAS